MSSQHGGGGGFARHHPKKGMNIICCLLIFFQNMMLKLDIHHEKPANIGQWAGEIASCPNGFVPKGSSLDDIGR